MARQIIAVTATTGEPIVACCADSYADISEGFDDYFNPNYWSPASKAVVFDAENDEVTSYVLDMDKNWIEISGVEPEEEEGT